MRQIEEVCPRCSKVRETPFCPTCGVRLVDNEFIGQTREAIDDHLIDAGQEYSTQSERLILLQTEQAKVKAIVDAVQEKCRKLIEAREWASANMT